MELSNDIIINTYTHIYIYNNKYFYTSLFPFFLVYLQMSYLGAFLLK